MCNHFFENSARQGDFKAVIDAAFFPHGQRAQRLFFMRKFADHDAPDFKRFHEVPGQMDKEIMTD